MAYALAAAGIGKIVVAYIPPLTAISYAALVGALLLFFPAVMDGMFGALGEYALLDWGNIAYLGVFGTVLGFVWYYEGIKNIGAVKAGLFINFVPIFAIFLAFSILSEPITVSLLIGAILVTAGVYLANRTYTKTKI